MYEQLIVVTADGLVVAGVQSGLRIDLMPPAFVFALWSLRRSPEAGRLDKFLRVLAGTCFGAWGGWPLALAVTSVVPKNLHRYLDVAATLSPTSLQYLTAGLIGYAGFTFIDRWLFPVRAAQEPGEQ